MQYNATNYILIVGLQHIWFEKEQILYHYERLQNQQTNTKLLKHTSKYKWAYWASILLISPLKRDEVDTSPSFPRRKWKREVPSGFVKQSASWSEVGTHWTRNLFSKTWSLTKWASISICLVLACNTGLDARAAALMLSHQITEEDNKSTWSSWSKDLNHISSAVVFANPRYSDSAEERETTTCFFEDQEINDAPKNTK